MSSDKLPVSDGDFWRKRINRAVALGHDLHTVIYVIDPENWKKIQDSSRKLFAKHFEKGQKILDVGAGYGAAAEVMPEGIEYVGIELSQDLVDLWDIRVEEKRVAPWVIKQSKMYCATIERFAKTEYDKTYDWAVVRSIRGMILDNLGVDHWRKMEEAIKSISKKILYIEYGKGDIVYTIDDLTDNSPGV